MNVSQFFGAISFVLALGILIFVLVLPTRIPSSQIRLNYLLLSAVILLGTLHDIVPIPESVNVSVSGVVLALSIIVIWRFVRMRSN